jgi:pimeloyl-ACP methyl ester carboxylesterase
MRTLLRRGAVTALALSLLAAPARAEAPQRALQPLLDTVGVPGLGPNGHLELSRTLLRNLPRVFVIGPGGAYAARSGPLPVEELERLALEACQSFTRGNRPCIPWLRDLDIVWPGRAWAAPAAPPGLAFGDARRITLPDPRFLWWGPGQARGVLVWAHGRNADGSDSRGSQPQSWVRHFNNAGWDVWRFDRAPETDATRAAAGWLREAVATLRARGYGRVAVAGQSRGAWNALQLLDQPGLAEVAIAIAPAALPRMDAEAQAAQLAALRGIVARAAGASGTRVAVANFREDPFDGLPEERAAALRGLRERAAAFLLIDRPDGILGHAAGGSRAFAERFGGCLFLFATAEVPPPGC